MILHLFGLSITGNWTKREFLTEWYNTSMVCQLLENGLRENSKLNGITLVWSVNP